MVSKRKLHLIIPPVMTVVLILMIYIVKGVYPFGSSNIAYYDMNQSFIPCYARAYEVFHGNDSLVFDWIEGAGMDMTSTFPTFVLNPLNCFFWFLKPEYILDFMAWFLIIKLVMISLSISFYLKKCYDLPLGLHVILSLMYTFSGYIIQFYTNIWWLDTVAVLPVMVISLKRLMKKEKSDLYSVLLVFELLTCQYMSIMLLIFVLLYSFGMIYTEYDRIKRRKFTARIGISTVLAFAVSSVLLLPVVSKWAESSRLEVAGVNGIGAFGMSISTFQHQKLFMLFNTELAVAFFIILIVSIVINNKKKLSRETLFHIYLFFFMFMPVLNEGINLLWHMGSYVHFPFRCAFMLTFAGIDLIAFEYDKTGDKPFVALNSGKATLTVCGLTVCVSVVSLVLSIILYLSFLDYGICGRMVSYQGLPLIILLNTAFYLSVLCFFNKKIRERLFCVFTVINIAVASVCFIAPFDYSRLYDFNYYVMRDKFILDSTEIRNNANLENDGVSRIKTLYPCLSRNYPMILGIPSLNQWLNECTISYFDELEALGYDYDYTSSLDSGGTYLSDAVLNNKKVIAYGDVYVPENAFTKYASVGNYTIYDMNYALPFGMLTDEEILDTNCEKITAAEHQIHMADAFSDDEIKVFSFFDSSEAELISSDKENKKYVFRYNIHSDSSSLLYICTERSYEASVNGRKVTVPYFDETDNMQNKRIGKNTINLISGFDKDEEAIIDIVFPSDKLDNLQLILLDLEEMAKLSEKYERSSVSYYKADDNRLDMTADVDGNNYLFLPLEYLEGWHAKVNGNDAEIMPVMNGAFMVVILPDGHCDINMTFMPSTIVKGAVITLIGLATAAVLFIMKKRGKDIAETPWVAGIASVCFNFVAVAVLIVMYILPVFI